MGISRKLPVDLEYPQGYFIGHEFWTRPTEREWLLVTYGTIIGAVLAYTLPSFFVIRRLYRHQRRRPRILLSPLYVLITSIPFVCTLMVLIFWRGCELSDVIPGPPNVRQEVEQRARLLHARARDALLSAELGQGQFALIVRDFHHERPHSPLLPTFSPRLHAEEGLAKLFEGHMPLVTLASPADDVPVSFLETGILRLFVQHDQWQRTFRRLASHATLILVLIEGFAGPGLVYELTVAEELKRQADIIVLTPEDLQWIQAMNEESSLKEYEGKTVDQTTRKAPGDTVYVSDPLVLHLLTRIAGDMTSGLVQLRDRFADGQP